MVGTKGNILGLQIARICISDTVSSLLLSDFDFSWNYRVSMEISKKR